MIKFSKKTKRILVSLLILTTSTLLSYIKSDVFNITEDGQYVVSKVIDGDTLKVKKNGEEKTIRLLGINTPETVDPRRPVECFGKEASDYMKNIASDQVVRIELDPTQGEVDKYGRTLAYVYLSQGTFLNQKMIEDGYAFEYTYHLAYKYQEAFKKAEKTAREKFRGLWQKGVCDYK